MAVVRFRDEESKRSCCDPAAMQRRWGRPLARAVSRRLQQLEAMNTLADLDFLPFDSHAREDGVYEVEVGEELTLFVEEAHDKSEGGTLMLVITVVDVRERTTAREI